MIRYGDLNFDMINLSYSPPLDMKVTDRICSYAVCFVLSKMKKDYYRIKIISIRTHGKRKLQLRQPVYRLLLIKMYATL